MVDNESIVKYLNEFNMLMSQLESVRINFDDEIRALVLLSGLPETWDGLVLVLSNSCRIGILKFDDTVGVLLNKEACMKSSGAAETSESTRVSKRKEGQ